MRDGRIVQDGPPLADHGLPHSHHHPEHEHDPVTGHEVRLTSPLDREGR